MQHLDIIWILLAGKNIGQKLVEHRLTDLNTHPVRHESLDANTTSTNNNNNTR